MRRLAALLALIVLVAVATWLQRSGEDVAGTKTSGGVPTTTPSTGLPAFLPAEAGTVIARIQSGSRHPYRQDGGTFQNREQRLPQRPNGYYREYTVPTPGARDRGARRIVTGGDPPVEFWYTADHYRSFRAFEVRP